MFLFTWKWSIFFKFVAHIFYKREPYFLRFANSIFKVRELYFLETRTPFLEFTFLKNANSILRSATTFFKNDFAFLKNAHPLFQKWCFVFEKYVLHFWKMQTSFPNLKNCHSVCPIWSKFPPSKSGPQFVRFASKLHQSVALVELSPKTVSRASGEAK